jgi:hypothetical protein
MSKLFEAKRIAQDYFESIRPATTVHGFTRFIATDGRDCLIIDHPSAATGEWVFKCEIRNNSTYIELVTG